MFAHSHNHFKILVRVWGFFGAPESFADTVILDFICLGTLARTQRFSVRVPRGLDANGVFLKEMQVSAI